MKIMQAEDRLWIFEDEHYPRPQNALAGPFTDRIAAAWWIVEKVEKSLNPAQVAQWGKALTLAGGAKANPFQLIGILTLIRHKASQQLIDASSPAVWTSERAPEYPLDVRKTPRAKPEAA